VDKTPDDLARFRCAYRQISSRMTLLDFIKQTFPSAALRNICTALLYPLPEFLADEVHLATMGMSDNNGAIVDVLCSSSADLRAQVKLFYGIKFGDGRYSVKSKDGLGDTEKLFKDVKADTRAGGLRDLLLPLVEGSQQQQQDANPDPSLDSLIPFLQGASADSIAQWVDSLKAGGQSVDVFCKQAAGNDKELHRALLALTMSPLDFWTHRLHAALEPKINKRLLMRVMCTNDCHQRAALAKHYAEIFPAATPFHKFWQDDAESKLIKLLFSL